jgi:hypothetical protein
MSVVHTAFAFILVKFDSRTRLNSDPKHRSVNERLKKSEIAPCEQIRGLLFFLLPQ